MMKIEANGSTSIGGPFKPGTAPLAYSGRVIPAVTLPQLAANSLNTDPDQPMALISEDKWDKAKYILDL